VIFSFLLISQIAWKSKFSKLYPNRKRLYQFLQLFLKTASEQNN